MRLAEYLKQKGLTEEAFAEMVGNVSVFAVRKWRYGERAPRLPELVRIEELTGGAVTARDFLADSKEAAE